MVTMSANDRSYLDPFSLPSPPTSDSLTISADSDQSVIPVKRSTACPATRSPSPAARGTSSSFQQSAAGRSIARAAKATDELIEISANQQPLMCTTIVQNVPAKPPIHKGTWTKDGQTWTASMTSGHSSPAPSARSESSSTRRADASVATAANASGSADVPGTEDVERPSTPTVQELAADYMRQKGLCLPVRNKRKTSIPSFDEIFSQPWHNLPVRQVTPRRDRQATSMESDGSFQHVSSVTTPMEATPPEEETRTTPSAGRSVMLEHTSSGTQPVVATTGVVCSSSGGGDDPPRGHSLVTTYPEINLLMMQPDTPSAATAANGGDGLQPSGDPNGDPGSYGCKDVPGGPVIAAATAAARVDTNVQVTVNPNPELLSQIESLGLENMNLRADYRDLLEKLREQGEALNEAKLQAATACQQSETDRNQLMQTIADLSTASGVVVANLQQQAIDLQSKSVHQREEVGQVQKDLEQKDIGIAVLRRYLETALEHEDSAKAHAELYCSHLQAEHQIGLEEVATSWSTECETLQLSKDISCRMLESQSAFYVQWAQSCVEVLRTEKAEEGGSYKKRMFDMDLHS